MYPRDTAAVHGLLALSNAVVVRSCMHEYHLRFLQALEGLDTGYITCMHGLLILSAKLVIRGSSTRLLCVVVCCF